MLTTLARDEEQRIAFRALELGVVEICAKPVLAGEAGLQGAADVIRRVRAAATAQLRPAWDAPAPPVNTSGSLPIELIVVASSTGGPQTLVRLLERLGSSIPPLVVAQHLPAGFTNGFAEWLAQASGRRVRVATGRHPLERDTVWLGAEGHHLEVRVDHVEAIASPSGELAPSGDRLLRSAAAFGRTAIGMVLTGMGQDGAQGLLAMRRAGSYTLAQDAASSVVYGMPAAARDGACEVLSLEAIAARCVTLCHRATPPKPAMPAVPAAKERL
jgi:two-component system chemotaxis response regulator CheB